jgi:integrase/recombinase XerD
MKKDNEEIQYRYLHLQRETKGRKEGTIKKMESAFRIWNKISCNKSYSKPLKEADVFKFKDKLRERTFHGKEVTPGSVYTDLMFMKNFFQWLREQAGYKRIVRADVLECFNPSQDEKNYKNYHNVADYPTMQQVLALCRSVKIQSLIDLRNQAIIAMLFIGALRIDCLASLKIGSFNSREKSLDLNPNKGVRTKFSKRFKTVLFVFAPELMNLVTDWYRLLVDSGYGPNDPFFPKARQEMDGCAFIESTELTKEHISASRIRAMLKTVYQIAGMPYYNPHSYRHSCINQAMELAEDAQDIKAISMNVGHKAIDLIMAIYAQLPDKLLVRLIHDLGKNHVIPDRNYHEIQEES